MSVKRRSDQLAEYLSLLIGTHILFIKNDLKLKVQKQYAEIDLFFPFSTLVL